MMAEKTEKVKKQAEKKADTKAQTSAKKKLIFTIGKRKRSVARAIIKPGTGIVKVNSKLIESESNDVFRLRIQEPLLISDVEWKKFDFNVAVRGGGIMGQADAVRQSIARGLVELFGAGLKQKFMEYDKNLLVLDPRLTEPHKPPRSSQGPRRYKQRSKR
jgi:small subunit ribosomal protein S9